MSKSDTFCIGDIVKARFSDGQWYLGTVEEDNCDGTYTLAWLDGDDTDRIKAQSDLKLMRYASELQCYLEVTDQRCEEGGDASGENAKTCQAPGRIEVLVRHPFQDGEVSVVLPRHAKFKHVKRALSRALGSDGILHRGELMRREGGRYRGYKDSAYIGDVREVLVTAADFNTCGSACLTASLDDGEVSMDDEYIELRRVKSTGSHAAAPAEASFSPGARVELIAGMHSGKSGIVVELLGHSGMLTLKLESSKQVYAVKTSDCKLVEQQDQIDSPEEIIERLMKIREESNERYSSALEALQLRPGASDSDIARQYRRLSMRIHPDKCSLANASAAFQVLVKAHNRAKGQRGLAADRHSEVDVDTGVEDGLTLKKAMALLKELNEAFTSDDFKAKLDTLEFQKDCYSSSSEYLRDRHALFAAVHSEVLPRHGFDGTQSGIYKMLSQMAAFMEDEDFRSAATELNGLLGVDLLPKRWERVAKACQRHSDAVAKPHPAMPAGGYCGLALGGSSRGAPSGLLALARRAGSGAAPQAPPAPEEPLPWPAERRPPFRLFVAGSWNEYRPEVMRWERGLFLYQVVVTEWGTERFHLLKNGSEEGAFYPDVEDASPFEGFTILGPNDEGYGLNWQIGKFSEEKIKQGSYVVLVAVLDSQGALRSVDWQPGRLQPASASGSEARRREAGAVGSGSLPGDCLLPWEEAGRSSSWQADELDAIGA